MIQLEGVTKRCEAGATIEASVAVTAEVTVREIAVSLEQALGSLDLSSPFDRTVVESVVVPANGTLVPGQRYPVRLSVPSDALPTGLAVTDGRGPNQPPYICRRIWQVVLSVDRRGFDVKQRAEVDVIAGDRELTAEEMLGRGEIDRRLAPYRPRLRTSDPLAPPAPFTLPKGAGWWLTALAVLLAVLVSALGQSVVPVVVVGLVLPLGRWRIWPQIRRAVPSDMSGQVKLDVPVPAGRPGQSIDVRAVVPPGAWKVGLLCYVRLQEKAGQSGTDPNGLSMVDQLRSFQDRVWFEQWKRLETEINECTLTVPWKQPATQNAERLVVRWEIRIAKAEKGTPRLDIGTAVPVLVVA